MGCALLPWKDGTVSQYLLVRTPCCSIPAHGWLGCWPEEADSLLGACSTSAQDVLQACLGRAHQGFSFLIL